MLYECLKYGCIIIPTHQLKTLGQKLSWKNMSLGMMWLKNGLYKYNQKNTVTYNYALQSFFV